MVKRMSRRKTLRKSSRRKTMKRKNTLRRKTMKRKSFRRKTMKGGIIGMQCGKKWEEINKEYNENELYTNPNENLYTHILKAENNGWRTSTFYNIQMKINIDNKFEEFSDEEEKIEMIIEIPEMKLKDIKGLRNRIKKNKSLNKKLKVNTYIFKEFVRGNRNNCEERFDQINNFFKHIIERVESKAPVKEDVPSTNACVIKIIEILQSMKKLPKNFKPKFKYLNGEPFLNGVSIEDSDGDNVVLQEDNEWVG